MTIRKGEQWGESCSAPSGLIEFSDERALGTHIRDGGVLAAAVLKSGTLTQALGVNSALGERSQIKVVIDLIKIRFIDVAGLERTDLAVGSVLIRKKSWLGEICIASNSGYLGSRELMPKAHPNDGVFDLLIVHRAMGLKDRLQALRRVKTSNHIPHPDLSLKQVSVFAWPSDQDGPTSARCRLNVDGENLGLVSSVKLEILPDAMTLYI
jgi:hypothetical protein